MHAKQYMRKRNTVVALGLVMIMLASVLVMFGDLQITREEKIVRVACVGDSITEYSGYTHKLQNLLGYNYSVGNFGVAGATVSLDSKIAYMEQQAFQQAMNFHPDIVLIMLGTNDANLEITNDNDIQPEYSQLVNAFKQLDSSPQIVVVESPPIFATNSGYNNTYLTTEVIPTIENVAQQMNLPKVDMYDAFENHSDYFADGIHPNNNGSTLIASTMYDAVMSVQGYNF
jgi:lysophospholipase L1-like esterase